MDSPNPPFPPEPGFQEDNLNLRHYWHTILERRWLVITAFVSVVILCLIYLYKAPRIYQAETRLQIDREMDNVLNIKDVFAVDGREQDYLQTQYKNLKNRNLIESVANKLRLEEDPRYAKSLDRIKSISDDITVAPIRLSRLVDVRVQHTNPKMAAQIANELVRQFIESNLERKKAASYKALDGLKLEAAKQKKELEKADMALEQFKKSLNNVSLEENQNIVLQALRIAQEQMVLATSKAAVARKIDQEIQNLLAGGMATESIPQVANDRLVQELKGQLAVHKAQLEGLLKRYKDKHPEVLQQRERIVSIEKSIQNAAQDIIASIHSEAVITQSQVESMEEIVKSWEKKMLDKGGSQVQYNLLSREADLQREIYNGVEKSKRDLELTINNKINNMFQVADAVVPLKPSKPRFALTLMMGVLGGMVVALGLAFFVDYLDDSIKTQDDVEAYLRLPFLGYVPNIKSNSVIERDLQAHLHPQSTAAEGFRTIRAAVSLMPNSDKHRLLVVTSTIPSEGKSLMASNLAIVNAQTGLKTLLVDADLRRPSVHKAFQLHSPVGLSAYLQEQVSSMEEIVHTTEVPNLSVVCAGSIPSNPSELCGSKRMRQFIQEAMKNYDRVFLDCPPVSAVSDPLVIASMSDGVVFVTKFNKIRREHARKSIQRIQDAGIHVLGVVLNDIDFEGKDSYYYSYYYYQNRYYSSHYKSEKAESKPGLEGKKTTVEKA